MRCKHTWQCYVGMIRRFSVASGIGCRMQRKRLIRPTGWCCSYKAYQAIVILLSR
ncbi:Ribonucleoside-diphosphate reductase 1, beta subunit, B2 [Escherichia coli P12b]|nr:Ribonucleoside-diphosphate reductase 1, beta subunit, B2 [Escherichia coli P12b]